MTKKINLELISNRYSDEQNINSDVLKDLVITKADVLKRKTLLSENLFSLYDHIKRVKGKQGESVNTATISRYCEWDRNIAESVKGINECDRLTTDINVKISRIRNDEYTRLNNSDSGNADALIESFTQSLMNVKTSGKLNTEDDLEQHKQTIEQITKECPDSMPNSVESSLDLNNAGKSILKDVPPIIQNDDPDIVNEDEHFYDGDDEPEMLDDDFIPEEEVLFDDDPEEVFPKESSQIPPLVKVPVAATQRFVHTVEEEPDETVELEQPSLELDNTITPQDNLIIPREYINLKKLKILIQGDKDYVEIYNDSEIAKFYEKGAAGKYYEKTYKISHKHEEVCGECTITINGGEPVREYAGMLGFRAA